MEVYVELLQDTFYNKIINIQGLIDEMNIDKKWSDEELLTTAFLVENPSTIEKFLNEFQIELEKIYFIKSFEYEDIKAEIKQRNIVQITKHQGSRFSHECF